MSVCKIRQLLPATAVSEGAGVTVQRTIGTPPLRHLDPFLLLDHFSSDNPDEYIAGFPDHPHRGFITLTYMLDGHMLHQDSMGNRGDLRSGGIQWMKAASGVIHSEMPQQTNGLMRGFQLWINLPASAKMSDPEYQDFAAERIPKIDADGASVKLISGEHGGQVGPIIDPHTDAQYLDVILVPGRNFDHTLKANLTTFIYVFEGEAEVASHEVSTHSLVVFEAGEELSVKAGARGTRFILVAGRPLGEPIVQYGPFVMNSDQEIRQAFDDFRNNRLVRAKGSFRFS